MAENAEERHAFNERFWKDASILPPAELQLLKAELTRCFLRLPEMAANLLGQVGSKAA